MRKNAIENRSSRPSAEVTKMNSPPPSCGPTTARCCCRCGSKRTSQFVPGKLAAEKISITVPGVPETASVWEITTTGIHNLDRDRERVSGGVKITLRNFDQTACILLTSDQELIQQTRQRVAAFKSGALAVAWRWPN